MNRAPLYSYGAKTAHRCRHALDEVDDRPGVWPVMKEVPYDGHGGVIVAVFATAEAAREFAEEKADYEENERYVFSVFGPFEVKP